MYQVRKFGSELLILPPRVKNEYLTGVLEPRLFRWDLLDDAWDLPEIGDVRVRTVGSFLLNAYYLSFAQTNGNVLCGDEGLKRTV
jgi:hypothetical protein